MIDPDRLKTLGRPHGMPFRIGKIGHVVLNVGDVERSLRFYTEVLGFEVSDIYPDEMVPGRASRAKFRSEGSAASSEARAGRPTSSTSRSAGIVARRAAS